MLGKKSCFVLILIVFVQLVGIGVSYDAYGAGTQKAQARSKDFKKFPDGSPEAALTAFAEADVGDLDNRQNDERFPLWWNLTEEGGVPQDGHIHLYIKSYRIGKAVMEKGGNEALIDLILDVRVVWASGDPQINGSSWRELPVIVAGKKYSMRSAQFVMDVFGLEAGKNIIEKKADDYLVLKDMRKWALPVRMVKKNQNGLSQLVQYQFHIVT